MPYQEEPNYQLCTYKEASELAVKLIAIGINVETIYEIQSNGEKHDTTQPTWSDNGEVHQYVAKIWGGPEQSLAITNAMFRDQGFNYKTFSQLAAVSNKTPPEVAIMPLKGNVEAINLNLQHQMK